MNNGKAKLTQDQRKQKPPIPQEKLTTDQPAVSLQQSVTNPMSATPADVLRLQEEAGNQAVNGWLGGQMVQREPAANGSALLNGSITNAIQSARGSGKPLPPSQRKKMENQFNTDFSQVRLHTDGNADSLSQQIQARAFTTGSDIFFRQGSYDAGSPRGEKTLKHELTHVIQQGGKAPTGALRLGGRETPSEHQAQQNAQGGAGTGLAGSGGLVQREFNYASIASAFGSGITEEMVKSWLSGISEDKEGDVTAILMKGRNILEFQKPTLQRNGVNVAKMDADVNATSQTPTTGDTTNTVPENTVTSPARKVPTRPVPVPPAKTAGRKLPEPPKKPLPEATTTTTPSVTPDSIREYVLKKSLENNMPSGQLLQIVKDMGGGELVNVTTAQVDEAIQFLKDRDFDALAKKNVSISSIVAFTTSFEGKGVGADKRPDPRGAFMSAMLGGKGEQGAAYGVADFMEKSALWDIAGGVGGAMGSYGDIGDLFDPNGSLGFLNTGDATDEGIELAGGIVSNIAGAVQATGKMVRAGADFGEMYQAGKYHSSVSELAKTRHGLDAGENILQGLLGYGGAGFGFASAGAGFNDAEGDMTSSYLAMNKSIFGAASNAVGLGASGFKTIMSLAVGSSIKSLSYKESPTLTKEGQDIEKSTFPKLKALLIETQSKKALGQTEGMIEQGVKMGGNVQKAVGQGVGGDLKTVTSVIGLGISLGVPIAKLITGKVKGALRDKKVKEAGFQHEHDYRLGRMRELTSYDDKGNEVKDEKVRASVKEVRDSADKVYTEYEKFAKDNNIEEKSQPDDKAKLSISKLLMGATGTYKEVNEVLMEKSSEKRKAAIQNIILNRAASYL